MNHPLEKLLSTYFAQQEESGIPAFYLGEQRPYSQTTHSPFSIPVVTRSVPVVPNNTTHSAHAYTPTSPTIPEISAPTTPIASPEQPVATKPVSLVQPLRTTDQIRAELADLYRRGKDCPACPDLVQSRTQVVFGSGKASAKIMIIGDKPGIEEDKQGKAFVNNEGGGVLSRILTAVNIDKDTETFMTNVIKCRTRGNRLPSAQECRTCFPILKRQISIIRPMILLVLGKTAADTIFQSDRKISEYRGQPHSYFGIPAIVTFHPDEVFRNSALRKEFWEDIQKFQSQYRELTNG